MKTNLFSDLFKYTPRPQKRPLENFVIESFAYLLRSDAPLLHDFLSYMIHRNIKCNQFEVITQYQTPCGIIDTAVSWIENGTKSVLFIEYKVWSSPWELDNDSGPKNDQISKYCSYQDESTIDGVVQNYVVLISTYPIRGYSKDDKNHKTYLGNYTWQNIRELMLNRINNSSDQIHFLAELERDFIAFIGRQNMAGFDDFTLAELSSISFFTTYEAKRNFLVTQIQDTFKNIDLSSYGLNKYDSWGGNNIGDRRGVIFHDASENKEYAVANEPSIWLMLGLFVNDDDSNYPKSSYLMVPDVFCGVMRWSKNPKELNVLLDKIKMRNTDFNVLLGQGTDMNYVAVFKKEPLLHFIQNGNAQIEILTFLRNSFQMLTNDKGLLNLLLK